MPHFYRTVVRFTIRPFVQVSVRLPWRPIVSRVTRGCMRTPTRPLIRRLSHAERTRADILGVAVRLAAQEGIEGLSLGNLAAAVGMSKAGVFAHFGSKEALQLATVETAFAEFAHEVIEPAMAAAPGVPRLRAMIDSYFAYVLRRSASGGCFFTAASVEFDDRTGVVHDRIVELMKARSSLIETAIQEALGERASPVDVEQLAFEVIALGTGANVQFQLTKDPQVLERAGRVFEERLRSLGKAGGHRH
jgi:AcrR family transcriptional regulator